MNNKNTSLVRNTLIEMTKFNKGEIKSLDIYKLIGTFSTMVAQYELRIFNWFLEVNSLWASEEIKTDSTSRFIRTQDFKIFDQERNMTLDVSKFLLLLGKNDKLSKHDAIDKIISNKYTSFINRIISWAEEKKSDLTWFQEVRKYRHELLHDVDTISGNAFGEKSDSVFKVNKTLFRPALLLDFAVMFNEESFNSSLQLNLKSGSDIQSFFKSNLLLEFIYENRLIFVSGFKLVDKDNNSIVSVNSIIETSKMY